MAEIPSDIQKILEEETDLESPLSEQLFNKMGGTINALIDLLADFEQLSATGPFQVPEGVYKLYVLIWGGGGGGSNGNGGGTIGGGGGAGCVPQLYCLPVTPLDIYNFTRGTGGNNGSTGNPGTASSFLHSVTGQGLRAAGALGGYPASTAIHTGGNGLDIEQDLTPNGDSSNNFDRYSMRDAFTYGGTGNSINGGSGQDGQSSPYALGGNGGSGNDHGGGGGAGYGPGGNGSSTTSGTATNGSNGGGGGGGGGAKNGADGGHGGAFIFF